MGQPTTGIYFSASSPAAPPGDQLCLPLTDNEVPEQAVTFYAPQATATLRGTGKPDGTTIGMTADGSYFVINPATGGDGGSPGGGVGGGFGPPVVPAGSKDGSNTSYTLPAPPIAGSGYLYVRNGVVQRQLGVNAEFAVQGTQISTTTPLQGGTVPDWHEFYYSQGTPNSESGGGGSVTPQPLTLRGSNIASSNSATSISVTFPTGTAVGDLAICFVGHAWIDTLPAGWTVLYDQFDSIWWAAVIYKVLTSGDIATGNVSVTFNNAFDCVAGIVTFIGPTGGIRESEYAFGTSSATITNATTSAVLNTDTIIYFASSRDATAGLPTITPSSGAATTLQSAITTNSQSILADQAPPSGVLSVANNLATPGHGFAVQVVVKS